MPEHLPGRPTTDRLDAVWLCKVAERQMLPSFVPPPPIRRLRDLTRYRADLVAARTAEKQRVEKLPGDAQIKLSVVASDISGVSGRAMLAALVAGERDPKALAQLARRRLRAKLSLLEEAFVGHFSDHHAFLLQTMLSRIDQASADIAALERKIEAEIAPFQAAVDQLDEITGGRPHRRLGDHRRDRGRHGPLCHPRPPGLLGPLRPRREGVGRQAHGHGHHRPRQPLPGPGCWARPRWPPARPTPSWGSATGASPGAAAPSGPSPGVGRSILIIVWHLLADPGARFHDLGADFYDTRINADRKKRNHVRQLEALGYKVTLEPAA
jgi:transposase